MNISLIFTKIFFFDPVVTQKMRTDSAILYQKYFMHIRFMFSADK